MPNVSSTSREVVTTVLSEIRMLDEKTGADVQDTKEKLKTILEAHDRAIAATGG